MQLNIFQSSCHLKCNIVGHFIVLVIMQRKSRFICCLLIFEYKTGEVIYVCVLFKHLQHILAILW